MRKFLLAWMLTAGTMVVILTESLSLAHALDRGTLVLGWGLGFLAMAGFLYQCKIFPRPGLFWSIPLTAKILIAALIPFWGLLAFLAVYYSPNTWDAMTYHLPRVEHWVQDRTIAYYPTHIIRQDAYPPLAEWMLLQLRLLTGSDHFYGLLQWLAMVVSSAGVSLIAGWLGASLRGQALAAVLSAGLPMGIMQATSTQNDYVLTMWMVAFVYFFLEFMRHGLPASLWLSALGLGLACLTKGYAYLYVLPFLLWFLCHDPSRWSFKRLYSLGVFVIVGFLLNAGYLWRNWQAFHSFFLLTDPLLCGKFSLNIWLADLLRNTALHFGTIFMNFNAWVDARLGQAAALLHIDLNPEEGSYAPGKFQVMALMFNEDYGGNLLSVGLFVLALAVAVIQTFRQRMGLQWPYFWSVLGMFLLLSLVIRFQVFNSRFHLAIFVLGSAWTALLLERLLSKWAVLIGILVLLAGLPWFLFNHSKPLFRGLDTSPTRRIEEYFINDPAWIGPMAGISAELRSMRCRDIGFISQSDSKEYLWWMVLKFLSWPPQRFEHVDVADESAHLQYPLGGFDPCGVVLMSTGRGDVLVLPSGPYRRVTAFSGQDGNTQAALYVPER